MTDAVIQMGREFRLLLSNDGYTIEKWDDQLAWTEATDVDSDLQEQIINWLAAGYLWNRYSNNKCEKCRGTGQARRLIVELYRCPCTSEEHP